MLPALIVILVILILFILAYPYKQQPATTQDIESCSEHKPVEVAKLYRHVTTSYRNGHDFVEAYKLYKCEDCGVEDRHIIMRNTFPVYMIGEGSRKRDFIDKLERNNYINEEDWYLSNS